MFRQLLVVASVILLGASSFARQRLLVEFNIQDSDSTLAWSARLEDSGVTVRHIFLPNAAIVEAPAVSSKNLLSRDGSWQQLTVADLLDRPGLPLSKTARAAYLHLETESSHPPAEALSIPEPPYEGPTEPGEAPETSLLNHLTGQYLIGYVAVGIYLMESVGT
ncbi:MAG: hypothetical protein AB1772_05105 [Candidatus Zixiibacteriota bacterium]